MARMKSAKQDEVEIPVVPDADLRMLTRLTNRHVAADCRRRADADRVDDLIADVHADGRLG